MQYKLRYRDWDIAVDLSGSTGAIYIDTTFGANLVHESTEMFNTIDFFQLLDIEIDRFEAKINSPTLSTIDQDRDDIPY